MPLLAVFGGAYLMLLFLKIRGIIGFEGVRPDEFKWGVFSLALIVGGLAGVIAHYVFGALARPLVAKSGKRAEARDLRTIWGVSGFPIALTFGFLLLLDVLIGGRDVYLSSREGDSLLTGWSAGSLVLAVCIAGWSGLLFVKGLGIAGEMRPSRSFATILVACVCLLLATPIAFALVAGLVTLVGLGVDLVQALTK